MITSPRVGHTLWSNQFVFVLALIGTTVGLGNVWRFPYLVGQYGGSAFVLLYIGCVLVVGLPLIVAELLLGRCGRCSPFRSLLAVAEREGLSRAWGVVGVVAVISGLLLLSAYSVVGGWAMAYVFRAAAGAFSGLDAVAAARLFRGLTGDPERLLAWHTLFVAGAMLVVGRGLRQGIEEAMRWFIPLLVGLLLVLVVYAYDNAALFAAAGFLLTPDFARLDTAALQAALGHAFFSLSIGIGALMVFGAYSERRTSLLATAVIVVLADTAIALLAGLATFSIAFETGLAPSSGPGLIFETMPLAFDALPGGRYLATLFFAMLLFAAWTSAFAMLEPAVAWLAERPRVDRGVAVSVVGVLVWLVGVGSLLSFNVLSHLRFSVPLPGLAQGTLFDVLGFVTTGVLLPLTGLATAMFVGWRMSPDTLRLELGGGWGYRVWLVLVKFLTPIAVLAVFLQATGLLRTFVDWKSL